MIRSTSLKTAKWGEAKKRIRNALPDSIVGTIQRKRLAGESLKAGSYKASNTFAVIAAIYNVSAYLDDFFVSMTSQTIEANSLKIIAVDDGSTDDSAAIIRDWAQRYPELIQYVRKENGGQASARNLGLSHVDGSDWVTFIDPDDFVSHDYFERVDRIIRKKTSLEMVSCNFIFYNETRGIFLNTHPLKFRYESTDLFYNAQDDAHPIQLSMSTAFFKTTTLRDLNLRVNEDIKPNFEDGDFVNRYLLSLPSGTICFTSKAKYFYRKRDNGSSTLDASWSKANNQFMMVRKPSYLLKLLEDAHEMKGYVPRYIQNTVIYDLSWYFKRLVGSPQKAEQYLSDGTAEQFLELLDKIFKYIDVDCLEAARESWLSADWRKALLARYKHAKPRIHFAYTMLVRPDRKTLLVRTSDPSLQLFLDGEPLEPFDEKRTSVTFLGEQFQTLWFRQYRYNSETQELSYRLLDGSAATLLVRGSRLNDSTPVAELVRRFTKEWKRYRQSGDTWIIMDRINQADDNGEHFYRWIATNHPEQKCYFALQRTSPDWDRLKKEGFRLLDYGSPKHERELKRCSKIISSHADGFVHSYFGDNFLQSKDYIFLQHGVTKDDLSPWINGKPIDLMVTASGREHESIVADGSPYYLTHAQVALTGFPRHDFLLEKARATQTQKKKLLVMPTWRTSLTGTLQGGYAAGANSAFSETQYAKAWSSFLSSKRLREIMQEYDMEVVFYPHANSQAYLDNGAFDIPCYITIHHSGTRNDMQQAFAEASALVTDYSSVAFEMAYINRQTIYYQFDEEEFFSGTQAYAKGYFDYRQDGFGPVTTDEESLIAAIDDLARNGFIPDKVYQERFDSTFEYRDGKSCQRVYERIKSL